MKLLTINGKSVPWTAGITHEQAIELLAQDLVPVQHIVDGFVKVKLTVNQRAALTSLVWNTGPAPLHGTVGMDVNAGKYDAVPAAMMKWVHAGNTVLPGLVRRRAAEAALWNKK